MAQATFRYGTPNMLDHLPESAIAGGDVVVVGDTPMIAHRDMPAGKLGALAGGGGVYDCIVDGAVSEGTQAWWSNSDNKLTDAPAAGDTHFGFFLWDASNNGDLVRCLHQPRGETQGS